MATMNVPMSQAVRDAVARLRPKLGARSDAAAVRIAVARLCREHGIDLPGSDERPDPDDQPAPAPVPKPRPSAAEKATPRRRGSRRS